MNIALSSDNNYATYLHIVVASVLVHNCDSEIHFYIIDGGIDDDNKRRIVKTIEKYGQQITFVDTKELINNLKVDNSFPFSAYSRLYLTKLNNVDKIIYLDCDGLVNGDLYELWNIDLTSMFFAGVLDFVEAYYKKVVGLPSDYPYINSGMLLMNLKEMRDSGWEDKVADMINRYNGSIPHHDQGVINALGKGKTIIVKPKYNVVADYLFEPINRIMKSGVISKYYSEEDIAETRNNPMFIHFTAGYYGRPWDVKCTNPLKNLYIDMIDKAGYELKDVMVDKQENPHIVFLRNIYYKYPYQIYKIVDNLVQLRMRLIWMYRLRNVNK